MSTRLIPTCGVHDAEFTSIIHNAVVAENTGLYQNLGVHWIYIELNLSSLDLESLFLHTYFSIRAPFSFPNE